MSTGVVRLLDAIVPTVFSNYDSFQTTKNSKVWDSGIVKADSLMSQLISGGGRLFQHPYWGDLDDDASVIANDDPTAVIQAKKLATFKHQFVRQFRTQAWADARLVKELAGSDPMQEIAGKTGKYWGRQFDATTVMLLNGIFASNIANNSGDMVFDATGLAGTQTIGTETVNNSQLSAKAILEAKQTMGDMGEELSILFVHSRLYTNLQRQNLITFIPNSQGVKDIPTYLGYRLVISDQLPTSFSNPNTTFWSFLVAPGVLGFADDPVDKPSEVFPEPLKANGAGIDTLVMRKQYALHPYGFNWTDSSCAGQFPTDAEIATAANWTRVFPERKAIKMAAIKTLNG